MTRLINQISEMDSKSWIQLLNISGLVFRDMSSNIIADSLQVFFLSLDFSVATDK
jgi:hypothetical protein